MNTFPNEITVQIFSYLITPPQITPDRYDCHDREILNWVCEKRRVSLVNKNWQQLSRLNEFAHTILEKIASLPRFKLAFNLQHGFFKIRALYPAEEQEFNAIPPLIKNEQFHWHDGKNSYECKTGETFITQLGTHASPEKCLRLQKPILCAVSFKEHFAVNSGKKIHIISKNLPDQRYEIDAFIQPRKIFSFEQILIVQDVNGMKAVDFSQKEFVKPSKFQFLKKSLAIKIYLIKETVKELLRFFKTQFSSIIKKTLLYTGGISLFIISLTAIPVFCGGGFVIPLIVAAVAITAVFLGFLIGQSLRKELEPLKHTYRLITDPFYRPVR